MNFRLRHAVLAVALAVAPAFGSQGVGSAPGRATHADGALFAPAPGDTADHPALRRADAAVLRMAFG